MLEAGALEQLSWEPLGVHDDRGEHVRHNLIQLLLGLYLAGVRPRRRSRNGHAVRFGRARLIKSCRKRARRPGWVRDAVVQVLAGHEGPMRATHVHAAVEALLGEQELVDALPDESLPAAAVLLRRAQDPVIARFDAAPYDDEELSEEDLEAIRQARSEPGINLDRPRHIRPPASRLSVSCGFADASDELTFARDLSRWEPQNRLHGNHSALGSMLRSRLAL